MGEGAPASDDAQLGAPDLAALSGPERMERLMTVLAADSMEGRRTGTPGSARAARFIADELGRYGLLTPGEFREQFGVELGAGYGDGYFQHVPMVRVRTSSGRERLLLGGPEDVAEDMEVLGAASDVNVLGILPGSDPGKRGEAVILGAHFDHVGIGPAVDGDSIYNGADDDASGTAAVMEAARILAGEAPPERTVIFLLTTGEEMGLLGTVYYIEEPVVSMESTVADLQVEMVGRPDSLAGGAGRAWLTGFERSTLGEALVAGGVPLVPDPRPEANFFFRSDNIAYARIGIPAHTISSFNMHDDYHRPSDEVDTMDFDHMYRVTESIAAAVRILANGDTPAWTEGGRPDAGSRGGGR